MTALLCLLAAALPSLDASVSVGTSVRRLFYRDRLTPTLATWRSGALAVWGLSLQAYPSTGRLPILDDVGAYGWYKRSLESSTLTADGVLAFSTQEIAWEAGLRWRAMFAGQERGAVSIGYGSLRQVFGGARLPGYLLPAGAIQYWRPGLEGTSRKSSSEGRPQRRWAASANPRSSARRALSSARRTPVTSVARRSASTVDRKSVV